MEAVAVRAAEGQQAERALLPQRHERHRAHLEAFRAEEEFALRVACLAAARLAAREQGFKGFQLRILRRHGAHERRQRRIRRRADEHQRGVEGVEVLAQARFDVRDGRGARRRAQ
jgi:hypothetical protein